LTPGVLGTNRRVLFTDGEERFSLGANDDASLVILFVRLVDLIKELLSPAVNVRVFFTFAIESGKF